MIPKVFHQVWLGPAPLHPLMATWRELWRSLNPEWELRAWTSPDGLEPLRCLGEAPFESSFPGLLARACHYSQRSNILRYELVYRLGGVYLDTDFEPLQKVGAALDCLEAFVAPYAHQPEKVASAVFGAGPGHPWLCSVLAGLPAEDPAVSLSMGSDFLTRSTSSYREATGDPDPAVLPEDVFYHFLNPWLCPDGLLTERARSRLSPATVAVHQWSSKWYGRGFEPLVVGT